MKSSSFRGALTFSGVMAFAGLGDALLYSVLPIYRKEMGFSVFVIGLLLSINRFVQILTNTSVFSQCKKVRTKKMFYPNSMILLVFILSIAIDGILVVALSNLLTDKYPKASQLLVS